MNTEAAREVLLKHSRSDKNGRFPDIVSYSGKMTNPLCGDHVELRVHVDESEIREIGHRASACAICSASASLLCEALMGRTLQYGLELADSFEDSIAADTKQPWPELIEQLRCFEHLRVNPSRRMCAALPWVVFKSLIRNQTK